VKRIIFTCLLMLSGPTCGSASATLITTDLLIVGGTESGWAAAIQAARLGVKSITIVHDGEWLGGQFTEQALACVDENKGVGNVGWGVDWHPMKRSFHRSGLFKELMDRIETFNAQKYGSGMPGRPFHGPSTFRPMEAEAIFRQMLQPYIDSGQVQLITNHYPTKANIDSSGSHSRLTGLWFSPTDKALTTAEPTLHVAAKITIDASDWGEAIRLSGAAYECGPDPQSRYGEPSAPVTLDNNPANEMNPITWAMIVVESETPSPISKPEHFDDRNYPRATQFSLAEFRDLTWDHPNPGLGAIKHWPDAGQESARQLSVYTVRRITDGYASKTGKTIILLNYMNGQDYPLERLPAHVVTKLEATASGASDLNIVKMTRTQRQIVFDDAKQHALGVLYHLQTFVHDRATDKTNSFRRFVLSDEFGTADHLPPKPYIRESLRLNAMYMMREQDARNRDGLTKVAAKERFAQVMYPDGLFAWQFHYDFHRTGRTYLTEQGSSGPWIDYHKPNRHTSFLSDRSVFPLRSFVPEQMDGLLGAQKNVGCSSIVSAAIRLHDQCVAIGQASGAIAAVSLRNNVDAREIADSREHVESVRHALCGEVNDAVPLLIWPFRDLDIQDPAFVAVNRLAAIGAIPLEPKEVEFNSGVTAEPEWQQQVLELARKSLGSKDILPQPAAAKLTRGEYCIAVWRTLQHLPLPQYLRLRGNDADLDGIIDRDDPLVFVAGDAVKFEVLKRTLGTEEDGLPPDVADLPCRTFNFCGRDTPQILGFTNDNGKRFDASRHFGWSRDLTASYRQRNLLGNVAADTFVFTRTKDQWECDLSNGTYRVIVCVGDSSHGQTDQKVVIEGQTVLEISTGAGDFAEITTECTLTDGRLTVEIGSGKAGSNTCINWLIIEPRRTTSR